MLKLIMESVLSQDYPNIEHIIIDSESTDGSVELLHEYSSKYSEKKYNFIWKSEPDRNMIEGYNKALALLTGEYFMTHTDPFVNSSAVSLLVRNLNIGKYDSVCGGAIFQKDGVVIRRWSGKKGNWRFGWMAAQGSLCISTDTLRKHGNFSEKYTTSFDYDFQLRILMDKSIRINSIKQPIIIFFAGGVSNGTFNDNKTSIKENYKILKDNNVKFAWFTVLCKCIIAFCAYTFASRKNIEHELKQLPGMHYEEE